MGVVGGDSAGVFVAISVRLRLAWRAQAPVLWSGEAREHLQVHLAVNVDLVARSDETVTPGRADGCF